MERYPFGVVRQDEAGCDHQLREVVWIDAHVFVTLEIDSMGAQKFNRLRRVHILTEFQLVKQILAIGKGGARTGCRNES